MSPRIAELERRVHEAKQIMLERFEAAGKAEQRISDCRARHPEQMTEATRSLFAVSRQAAEASMAYHRLLDELTRSSA